MGSNRTARIVGVFVGGVVGLLLFLGGLIVATAPTAEGQSRCTNRGATCSDAREYGLAFCNSGKAPKSPAECSRLTEKYFQQCLRDGTWKTEFCNRKVLARK
jgi:hypothetical protein